MKRVELARLARIDGDDQVCVALLTVALLSPACLHSLCLDFAPTLITHFAYSRFDYTLCSLSLKQIACVQITYSNLSCLH